MNRSATVKFLAQLVHRGLLTAEQAQRSLTSADPLEQLLTSGAVTRAQWNEWVATEAGTRPILSRYELGDLLGEGGEARVYRARDRQTGETVALKILRAELAHDPVVRARFVAEAKLLIELRCPNIVAGKRVAREGDVIFSVMEVVDGHNLQDQLATDGPLDEDAALEVVRQAAVALAHLHEHALVHRDIKPGNLIRAKDGRVVLIDLGFAISGGDKRGVSEAEPGAAGSGPADSAAPSGTESAASERAATGPAATGPSASEITAGTVHYISPEQARGQGRLDVRADIYSLGATLYHLLTGSLPFSGSSGAEVMAKQVLEALSGAEIRAMDLSPQVHYLIEKMMAKDKEIRFQDPRQLANDVEAMLAQRRAERDREQGRPRGLGGRRDRDRDQRRRRRPR